MPFSIRHREDDAPEMAPVEGLVIAHETDPNERYLWNFVTRPTFCGRGIYPRLLQGIVRAESAEAERFWIIHAPENRASGSGISKAGFTTVGDLSLDAGNRPALSGAGTGVGDAAHLLGLPVVREPLAPCWRCARAGRPWVMLCAPGGCTCDYQDPHGGCGS